MSVDRHDKATGDLFQPLKGLAVVITGRLKTMTRKEAWVILEEMGATIRCRVSKRTDLVLIGSNPGQNAKRAHQLGLKVISEDDVLRENLWEMRVTVKPQPSQPSPLSNW